jgi:hypothetical protein
MTHETRLIGRLLAIAERIGLRKRRPAPWDGNHFTKAQLIDDPYMDPWQGQCTCGWKSPITRPSPWTAQDDAKRHRWESSAAYADVRAVLEQVTA